MIISLDCYSPLRKSHSYLEEHVLFLGSLEVLMSVFVALPRFMRDYEPIR